MVFFKTIVIYSNSPQPWILKAFSVLFSIFFAPFSDNMERLPQRQVSLNKFIRLAGDLLMPSLYTPYVNLLVSLSGHPEGALHCFNLLKMNCGPTGGGCSTVSWDHFFASLHQYFANLRQEAQMAMPNMMDSIYR